MTISVTHGHSQGNRNLRSGDGRPVYRFGSAPEEQHVVLRNRHWARVRIFIRSAASLVEHGAEHLLRGDVRMGALSVEKGQ